QVATVNNMGAGGASETATYGYDGAGRLHTLTNGRSNTTTYNYFTDGRLQNVIYPLNGGMTYADKDSYSYNNDGQVNQAIDGKGVVTTYGYDGPTGFLDQVTHGAGDASD